MGPTPPAESPSASPPSARAAPPAAGDAPPSSRERPSSPHTIDTSWRPFVLVWECTQACELACKHCRADAQAQRHPDELTTAEAKALLADARRFGEGQIVVLSGGDPLVRDDLAELVEYGSDLGLRMTLTPSGTSSLTDDRVDALARAGLRRMALSVDGASPSAHDEFRQESGSFEETVRAARTAREDGLPLQINTTVCQETVDELPAIRDLVADLGAVLWSVFFLVPVGRGRVLEPIDPERAERVMQWLCDVSETAPFGVKTTEAPHYRRVALQSGDESGGTSQEGGGPGGPSDRIGRRGGITAGDGFAFVSHVGEVYPSGFLPQSAGNVREESVVDVYRNAPTFQALRDPDALGGKCGACEFRNVCGGSRSRAFAYTGDPLASDPLCAYRPPSYDGAMPSQSAEWEAGSPVNP
jgi:radical SAM protein